ncbi:MAG: 50S ribosomal protein L6 [Acidimicrobiia bacterium]
MSRIGLKPIPVPSGVEVSVSGSTCKVKGPKGELQSEIPAVVTVSIADGEVKVARENEERQSKALHGLTRQLIANNIVGVSEGYMKALEIVGVGYRAQAQGTSKLDMALGFSHPVVFEAPEGITFVTPTQTRIEVSGIDKQLVGQVAANIRKLKKPEPYKGKGIRYEGEYVRRKAGKSAK